MSDHKTKVMAQNPEYITLKVMTQDNVILEYKVKKHAPLKKLIANFCKWQGCEVGAVRFRMDGMQVNGEDTPSSLELEEGDTIEVYQQQIGGATFNKFVFVVPSSFVNW